MPFGYDLHQGLSVSNITSLGEPESPEWVGIGYFPLPTWKARVGCKVVFISLLPGEFEFDKILSFKGRSCSEEKNALGVLALGVPFPPPSALGGFFSDLHENLVALPR